MDDSKAIKVILQAVNRLVKNKEFIRIIDYGSFYFVATDKESEAMIFDKEGTYTGEVFSEIDSIEKKNPKEVYYEE